MRRSPFATAIRATAIRSFASAQHASLTRLIGSSTPRRMWSSSIASNTARKMPSPDRAADGGGEDLEHARRHLWVEGFSFR
jgi:hypothetical protein